MWPTSPHYDAKVSGDNIPHPSYGSLYLIALSGVAAAAAAATSRRGAATHGAVPGDVASLATLVASLVVLHGLGAVAACRALVTGQRKLDEVNLLI
jgi:hypothetical protein